MSCSLLLSSRSGADPALRWDIAMPSQGLCVPTTSPNGQYSSLAECQRWARPEHRELRWNVVNSSGYGPQGQVVGECRPTLDPYAEFSSAEACASSPRAQYQAYPDPHRPKGWICTNPVLGVCVETEIPNGSFTYPVYHSYEACVNAPENRVDSSVTMGGLPPLVRPQTKWYINADRNRCDQSFLNSAPFDDPAQCQKALEQCNSSGQPTLQFSNPMQAADAHWNEPYLGFRQGQGRNVSELMQTPQIPLNPVNRPPVIGQQQVLPGTSGQGYSLLG